MNPNEAIDLYTSVMVVGTEKPLLNRLDTSIDGIKSNAETQRKIVGLMGRCANTGYIVGRVDGKPVATIDMATLNAMTSILPLEIDVPQGQSCTWMCQSSSGTAAAQLTVFIEKK